MLKQLRLATSLAARHSSRWFFVPALVLGFMGVWSLPAGAAPGELDTSFAGFTGGITPNGPCVEGMALMPDGRIVVVGRWGDGFQVRRYLTNGDLDPSFSGDGIATPALPAGSPFRPTCVAVQPNGRIAVGGWLDLGPANFGLAVLNSSGAIDLSFNITGFANVDFDGDTDIAEAVLFQPDGKIVLAGRSLIDGDYDFSVARFHSGGAIDVGFDWDGRVTVPFGGEDKCHAMALQPDGKLVLVGQNSGFLDTDFAVARLNTNGSLDATFDGDGKRTIGFGDYDIAQAVAIQSDGKIVLSGGLVSDGNIARLTPNGSLDASFSGDGKVYNGNNNCEALAIQPDGRIIVAGHHISPDNDWKAAFHRYHPNGSLDLSLGNGVQYIDLGGTNDRCNDVAVLPDGRILGNCEHAGSGKLLRMWPDGALDSGGRQTIGFEDNWTEEGLLEVVVDATCYGMAVQGDGKMILAGEAMNPAATESDIVLTRLTHQGLIDPTFGIWGRAQFGLFNFDAARAVAVQPDGKIVVAGYLENGSIVNFMVSRFLPWGSVDEDFGLGGVNVIDFAGGEDYGAAVAVAPDGKIVVAGTVFNGARFVFGVARFNSNGSIDTSFNFDGKRLFEFTVGLGHEARAVVVQPDGKIVVAGTVEGDFALVRFNENGSVDGTFGASGKTITNMGGSDGINALVRADDGFFYAAGYRYMNGNFDFALAQYRANGILATCNCPFPNVCGSSRDCPPSNVWLTGKAFMDFGGSDIATAIDVRDDGYVVAAGTADGRTAWVQYQTNTTSNPITGLTDFPGTDRVSGVKYTGLDWIVTAGTQDFSSDLNFAAARFWTTPGQTQSAVGDNLPHPVPTVLLHAYPNPLVRQSRIAFDLDQDDDVRLSIHDLAGRLVSTLVDGRLDAGRHEPVWNGRDQSGRRVAAGVYFARLQGRQFATGKSIVVIE